MKGNSFLTLKAILTPIGFPFQFKVISSALTTEIISQRDRKHRVKKSAQMTTVRPKSSQRCPFLLCILLSVDCKHVKLYLLLTVLKWPRLKGVHGRDLPVIVGR